MNAALWQALVSGPLRAAPGRTALAVIAIAIGIALGVAVHLINASAAAEFARAARQLAGTADLTLQGSRAGFDEALYPRIARLPEVAAASPALEFEASRPGSRDTLHIIGMDALRAWPLQPALATSGDGPRDALFDADAIRLSASAARALRLDAGDTLELQAGTRKIRLRVTGVLADGAYRQHLGIMDIAAAQWRFERIGRLTRIDLRLQPGTDVEAFRQHLQPLLPPGVHAQTPQAAGERADALTRAYRLNLDMLAMMALFTGAFLVYSSQVLALLRRRTQLALLRTLGVTPRALLAWLLAEGACIGALGAALGIAGGYLLALQALTWSGADLGAGYFRTLHAQLAADPLTLAAYGVLGIAFAVAGTAIPAWTATHRPPAQALHAGDDEAAAQNRNRAPLAGLLALLTGIALTAAPPYAGLPVAGYAAIALLLIGAVLLMPAWAGIVLARLPRPAVLPLELGLAQLQAAPRHTATSIAAILVSFSLVVAMLIMVTSFRSSLQVWLDQVLPADLYLRAARSGETAYLSPEEQLRIAQTPGVARADFLRTQRLLLTSDQAPLTLIARELPDVQAARSLPLMTSPRLPPPDAPPAAWISEVAAGLHGWRTGQIITLPLGGNARAFTVAGIWRDYARQNGAVAIDRALYITLTGDRYANDASIRLAPGANRQAVEQALRTAIGTQAAVEIASAADIRKISLDIFDRTFAITWALEIAALIVGLIGVGLSFSAQALARQREFGVLRHLGMSRRQIGVMLASEGALTAALGALCGIVAGTVIGFVLIRIINRQSFHWSMDFALPWLALPGLFVVIVLCAAATAAFSARLAMRPAAIHAVREDW